MDAVQPGEAKRSAAVNAHRDDPAVRAEVERQFRLLSRGAVEIIPEDGLREKIRESVVSGRPLRVKLGLDPSAPDVHLGHTVVLQKLRQFQELGHVVQLVIGDFTGRIGDPTGKSETRRQLSEAEVRENAATYVKQFGKILDMSRVELVYNSAWLEKLTFAEVLKLAAKMTVARMLERDDFEKRYTAGQPIGLHEFFYPLMQAYDSVVLRSDVELGGTDQKFNLLMGRELMRDYGLPEQVVLMMPLLEGTDGVRKMSKSLGNYIGIDEPPETMYGKVMSIPDDLMLRYYALVTDLSEAEVEAVAAGLADGSLHPRDAKMRLARRIVAMYHGEPAAEAAERHFRTVFQEGGLPEEIEERRLPEVAVEDGTVGVLKLLQALGLVSSLSEARRMVEQRAVRIDGERILNPKARLPVREGMVVQVGKRLIARVTLGPSAREDVRESAADDRP